MNLKKERELVVFIYLLENGKRPISEIQAELEITGDEDFQFEETFNDLFREDSIQPKTFDIVTEKPDMLNWEITEIGKIRMNDLAFDKYEDINRMSYIIMAIIFVVAILAFIKIFPKMFHQ